MNCLTIVSPSFAPWDQIALLQRRTSRMLSGLSLFILTIMVFWVSLGKINCIMTSVSPWAVSLPARLLNLSPLLCVCEICHTIILDDFIFFGPSNSPQCHTSLQAFLILAKSLNIPLRTGKTVYPTTLVSLHDIEVDTAQMQMRLPQDKLLDARLKIDSVYRRKKVSLRQLQSLIGTLSFACKVIVPGRVFLRRVIDLTCGEHNQEHLIRLMWRPDWICPPGGYFYIALTGCPYCCQTHGFLLTQ